MEWAYAFFPTGVNATHPMGSVNSSTPSSSYKPTTIEIPSRKMNMHLRVCAQLCRPSVTIEDPVCPFLPQLLYELQDIRASQETVRTNEEIIIVSNVTLSSHRGHVNSMFPVLLLNLRESAQDT